MSQVSQISTANQGLYQLLQELRAEQQSQAATASSTTAATAAATDVSQAVQPTQHHHHHGHGKAAMFKKIEATVTSALQSAQSDPTADPNQVIEQAIAKFFKDNGITPRMPGANGETGASDNDGDDNAQTNSQPTTANDAARQAFAQLLGNFGVSPEQFRQDFLAAIKDAQGGQVDANTAFQSFTPGAIVNTTT